jgi:hypothetical protein
MTIKKLWRTLVLKVNRMIIGDRICVIGPHKKLVGQKIILLHRTKIFQVAYVLKRVKK